MSNGSDRLLFCLFVCLSPPPLLFCLDPWHLCFLLNGTMTLKAGWCIYSLTLFHQHSVSEKQHQLLALVPNCTELFLGLLFCESLSCQWCFSENWRLQPVVMFSWGRRVPGGKKTPNSLSSKILCSSFDLFEGASQCLLSSLVIISQSNMIYSHIFVKPLDQNNTVITDVITDVKVVCTLSVVWRCFHYCIIICAVVKKPFLDILRFFCCSFSFS